MGRAEELERGRSRRIAAAFALDALLGDPEGYPHPVRVMGAWVERLERRLGPRGADDRGARLRGCLLAALVAGGSWAAGRALLAGPWPGATETLLLYTAFAWKDLERSALKVAEALERGEVEAARSRLRALVGRDTEALDEGGICRAAVESVAENYCDGVLAPLLWAAVGGAPAALAFKAVSTMDSMLGHKDERHLHLGWCPARLDDLAVLVPARISLPLIWLSALACGLDAGAAWRIGIRDRRRHASPNSAYPEAAFAGALGLELGGEVAYRGETYRYPTIGEGSREATPAHLREALRLLRAASLLGLCLAMALAWWKERGGGGA
ncbi:MAG: cobalamin biosynthesis protein CobD [Actinobacteria bacterium]|nr:cobalamin biosynthesis protein CobD [Actinomycetota bacterium]MDI6831555.1 adenosylcobinamide-phosphate synthase CbiB [Actinomycetota bacterium]